MSTVWVAVYVVDSHSSCEEDYKLTLGVFSTLEKAREWVESQRDYKEFTWNDRYKHYEWSSTNTYPDVYVYVYLEDWELDA